MKDLAPVLNGKVGGREGFVIPAVIFSLLLMSFLAVAALLTAGDEMGASRAIRESEDGRTRAHDLDCQPRLEYG